MRTAYFAIVTVSGAAHNREVPNHQAFLALCMSIQQHGFVEPPAPASGPMQDHMVWYPPHSVLQVELVKTEVPE